MALVHLEQRGQGRILAGDGVVQICAHFVTHGALAAFVRERVIGFDGFFGDDLSTVQRVGGDDATSRFKLEQERGLWPGGGAIVGAIARM